MRLNKIFFAFALNVCSKSCTNAGLTHEWNKSSQIDPHRNETRAKVEQKPIEVISTCKKKGTFALTYDDGPYQYENQISDFLSSQGAKGTFFVNGLNYGCIYEEKNVNILRRTFSQGHVLGSHTWSHANISNISEEELNKELLLLEIAFKKILGIKPKLFRPPYGEINARGKKVLARRGYTIVNWSFESGDAVGVSPAESVARYKRISYKYMAPQISLDHETHKTTATQVTPKAVKILHRAGYKLVSVPECLGLHSYYEYLGAPQKRDHTWIC